MQPWLRYICIFIYTVVLVLVLFVTKLNCFQNELAILELFRHICETLVKHFGNLVSIAGSY